ncbi:hypothetical protein C8R43DRAFT_1240820 [Mycena crocata]|nr:hypothetical protein C8R43DRAFT_1240820 [Mycena crocata]
MAYYPTKITSPSPPPTTNSLTSQQRSQLLRTTQKLGRLLGTTPALIEETDSMPSNLPLNLQRLSVPLHIQLSSVYDDDDALVRYPSSETVVSSASSHGSSSLKRSSSLSSQYSMKSRQLTTSVHVNESWPKAGRPFLRIAVKRPSKLEAIPQSPPANGSPPPPYSPEPAHTSFTIRPIPATRRPASAPPPLPSFSLPSTNSLRRQKMDRLRRTLGDGVPLDLVFPDEETHPVPILCTPSAASSDEDLPRRVPRPRSSQTPRISAARDSLVVPTAHAPRQRFFVQHSRPAPPPPSPTPPRSLLRAEKKLSIIAEREEPIAPVMERPSTDSESYQGDTEADPAPTRHRRSSRLYDQADAHRIRRVPVPIA